MTKSLLREGTDSAVFLPEVAKQHDVFADAIAFRVLVSACASFRLDNNIRKLFECFNEDLPKLALVSTTALVSFNDNDQNVLNKRSNIFVSSFMFERKSIRDSGLF